jgi:hypothetical protein
MATHFAAADTGLTLVNTALVQEAYRIGKDVYKRTLHVSPWINLTKQSTFQDGMGHTQMSMIYDRALPTTDTAGNTRGVTWHDIANLEDAQTLNTNLVVGVQPLLGATVSTVGPSGNTSASAARSYLNLARKLKSFSLKRAVIESPKISLEDLRFAAYREEQIKAVVDLMTEASRYTWEERYRDEYEDTCDNFIQCKSASTAITTGTEGSMATEIDVDVSADDGTCDIDAKLSNAILDKVYQRLIRAGAGLNAYGRENGRPIFALVCSSELSYSLQTEPGFRDDVRYNNSKVSDLIAPLGVEKSFRGFYHLIDDLTPRFSFSSGTDRLVRVDPYTVSGGVVSDNASYDTADYEVAYVLHQEVMESQIPNPYSGSGSIKFNPVNYRGEFKWTNIPDMDRNPDGTIGFFRGILASATKAIKTEFGYVIVFKRTTSTLAA